MTMEKAGDSSPESREAINGFFESMNNLEAAAHEWANHHGVIAVAREFPHVPSLDIVVAFATAVDLGYRIAKQEKPR